LNTRSDDLLPYDPPLEAYGRVTNPERFRPLHRFALDFFGELQAEFDVMQLASFDRLPSTTAFEHSRPPVTLTPVIPGAAPIAIAFTTFPSLLLRFGRWQEDSFPSCGCDACAETVEREAERFRLLVQDVVAGRFREELKISWLREPRL
jgi:hypothetical protein